MASTAPKYYRPYFPSDSEESDASADDSEAESEIIEHAQIPDYVGFAKGLFRASGPPFQTEEKEINPIVLKQLKSLKNTMNSHKLSINDIMKHLKDNE